MRGERILRVLKICNTACLVKLFGFCLTKACEEQLRLKSILDQAYKAYSNRLTIIKGSQGGTHTLQEPVLPNNRYYVVYSKNYHD